ncbi:LemA family protein [Luteolibacter algae]|uniref:LemA family protein n=1 Tax=Luteolibacter algae TaxID=454151 RepID=A0ABW5D5M9_9BACT
MTVVTGLVVILGVIFLVGIFAMGVYNGLVKLRNMYKNAFSQIDVQLKRRHDLIPNLVETAKAYMSHERETLEAVISARNMASDARENAAAHPGDPAALEKLGKAEAGLGGVVGRLFAVAEAYPELKANQNMMQLSEELTTTENKVAFSRQAYNDSVLSYNNKREVFPNNIIAGMFGFHEAAMFQIDVESERQAPKVQF